MQEVTLRLGVSDLLSADRLEVSLNGVSLAGETCTRSALHTVDPYMGQWLAFDLRSLRPRQGENVLSLVLQGRPENIGSEIAVEDLEVIVTYGTFPAPRRAGAGEP